MPNASARTLPPLASPLRRPRIARTVTITLGVLLLLAALIICAVVTGLGSEATRVFLTALAISSALSVVPVAILWYLDRRERESPWLFAAAFLWGGLIATAFALPANTAVIMAISGWLEHNASIRDMLGPEAAVMIGAPVAAPVVEETLKGLGIVLIFWLVRGEFDNLRDGFIYGALVGAGFNWSESALYVQQNFAQFGTAPYGFQLGMRYAWLGLAGHAMFSGIFGASLGLARMGRRSLWRWLVAFGGYLLAIVGHTWNNALPLLMALAAAQSGETPPTEVQSPPTMGLFEAMTSASISNLVIFLPFALLLAWIIRRGGRWERDVIREELADEVGRGLTAQEYAAVERDATFRTRRIDARNREASVALVIAQNELAFRKRRLKDRGFDPERDPVVERRRDEISALRARMHA